MSKFNKLKSSQQTRQKRASTSKSFIAEKFDGLEDDKTNVSVIFPSPYRSAPRQPFALLFFQNCLNLMLEKKLGLNELMLLFYLLKTLDDQNIVLSLSKTKIAADLKLNRSVISRAWKRLEEQKVLMGGGSDHVYINPHLITRAGLSKIKNSEAYELDRQQRDRFIENFPLQLGF